MSKIEQLTHYKLSAFRQDEKADLSDRIITPYPAELPVIRPWEYAGMILAYHLQEGKSLLLDMDGVVVQGNSLFSPRFTSPEIPSALRALEEKNARIGVATARGSSILDYLRKNGLAMSGPAILEEGQVLQVNGERHYFVPPEHRMFIKHLNRSTGRLPYFRESWNEVKALGEHTDEMTFCHGNYQWQGNCRRSFWYYAKGERQQEVDLIETVLFPEIEKVARVYGLHVGEHISVGINRMPSEHLGMVVVKAIREGKPIDKSAALESLEDSFAFVADGFGDTPLAEETHKRRGAVLAIKGNLDESAEPPRFLSLSEIALEDPAEFAKALYFASDHMQRPVQFSASS